MIIYQSIGCKIHKSIFMGIRQAGLAGVRYMLFFTYKVKSNMVKHNNVCFGLERLQP